MAKNKTVKNLEDMMKSALFKEEEQLYAVPGNWAWVRLGSILSLEYEKNQGIIDKGLSDDIKSLKNLFYKEDILYGKLRPYLNKHDIANFDGICSTDILVIKCRNTIVNKFLNYHFDLTTGQKIILNRITDEI